MAKTVKRFRFDRSELKYFLGIRVKAHRASEDNRKINDIVNSTQCRRANFYRTKRDNKLQQLTGQDNRMNTKDAHIRLHVVWSAGTAWYWLAYSPILKDNTSLRPLAFYTTYFLPPVMTRDEILVTMRQWDTWRRYMTEVHDGVRDSPESFPIQLNEFWTYHRTMYNPTLSQGSRYAP